MLSKAITLHLIYLVQEKHSEMVPSLTVFLVDLLNGFLSCCGQALQKLDIIAKQKGCYCAEDIVESTPVVICRDCDRKMHLKCTNSA